VAAQSLRVFDAADELELREMQFDRAIALLQPLSLKSATRPEALLRMARIEYKTNKRVAALETYKSLSGETSLSPSGTPYALIATAARCRILKESGMRQEASREAQTLRAGLLEGRWPLSRDAFEYQWSTLDSLGTSASPPPKPAVDFSILVADLYDKWQTAQSGGINGSGRENQPNSSLLVWNATPDRLSAFLTLPDWLKSNLKLPADSSDVHWTLLAPGSAGGNGFTVTRSLAEVHLQGRLGFSNLRSMSNVASSRRTLLLGGSALMLMVILGSGYVVHRAISRELHVGMLQSDFVAAVSHEFRSPLTSLRSITELLAQNRISDESRRQKSYVFLDRETARLHRLVEDLLDFGRMESRRKQYRMDIQDAFQLVRATLTDFSEQAETSGFHVETDLGPANDRTEAKIQVDDEAFQRALRNLLDNAIKYSPVSRTIWVNGTVRDRQVMISVRDRGMGIEAGEQQAIFQRFVRGDAAKRAGIKGTGIGLAMVRQISEAMGGKILLQSEVGVGSTFTIVLPLAEESERATHGQDSGDRGRTGHRIQS
jgi:signal transduction histidine kinase